MEYKVKNGNYVLYLDFKFKHKEVIQMDYSNVSWVVSDKWYRKLFRWLGLKKLGRPLLLDY